MKADAACRSCGAAIRWVQTINGRRMPMDVEPAADGNVWLTGIKNGTPQVLVALTADAVPANVPVRYHSHFVTCPQADEWRRP